MPIEIACTIFSVDTYSGKNGLGCNAVLLNTAEKGKLEVNSSEQEIISEMVKHEGEQVLIKAKLTQNKFGMRCEVLEVIAA